MIINVRGTSGSGKSTLIRAIMDLYPTREVVRIEGRKQPLYYICRRENRYPLAVLGHYETDCGGCDTINGLDLIYELVEKLSAQNDVLFEGLLISAEFQRTERVMKAQEGVVLHIDIPLQECLDSVNGRRAAKAARLGKPDPGSVNPVNTESKWKGTRRTVERLREAGVNCFSGSREDCLNYARRMLNV